ncbi:glycine-rich domain-containing protein [Mongoliibacter sp.]|uniref:glycine-rich domain-containing protein n=1 Tax=Mongoliibacter sp. TaxID=2022438 RepID=UPI0025CC0A25|nr:hypothetical protein [Mongoliibacter sp.]
MCLTLRYKVLSLSLFLVMVCLSGKAQIMPFGLLQNSNGSSAGVQATGGTVTDITDKGVNYRVHTFTTSGNFIVTVGGEVEYLIVAGGGGGGANHAGGGGAGGLLTNVGSIPLVVNSQSYAVTVGVGGAKSTNFTNTAALNGGNSSFATFTAIGGGGGGNRRDNGTAGLEFGKSGGSGGGGGGQGSNNTPTITGGTATSGQGFAGGTASFHAGAGGGGAGGVGETTFGSVGGNTSTTYPGDGGPGLSSSISGTTKWYAGGGGGGGWINGPFAGFGGSGVGGDGQINGSQRVNGTANTGSGGGGANGGGNTNGGNGGSGIVIIRYVR